MFIVCLRWSGLHNTTVINCTGYFLCLSISHCDWPNSTSFLLQVLVEMSVFHLAIPALCFCNTLFLHSPHFWLLLFFLPDYVIQEARDHECDALESDWLSSTRRHTLSTGLINGWMSEWLPSTGPINSPFHKPLWKCYYTSEWEVYIHPWNLMSFEIITKVSCLELSL